MNSVAIHLIWWLSNDICLREVLGIYMIQIALIIQGMRSLSVIYILTYSLITQELHIEGIKRQK